MHNSNYADDAKQVDETVIYLKVPASPSSLNSLTDKELQIFSGETDLTCLTECAGIC